MLSVLQDRIVNIKSNIAASKDQASSEISTLSEQVTELRNANQASEECATTLGDKLEAANQWNTQLLDQVASLQESNVNVAQHLCEKESALDASTLNIAQMSDVISKLLAENDTAYEKAESTIDALKDEVSCAKLQVSNEATQLLNTSLHNTNQDLENSLREKGLALTKAEEQVNKLENKLEAEHQASSTKVVEIVKILETQLKQCTQELEHVTREKEMLASAVVKLAGQEKQRHSKTAEVDNTVRLAKKTSSSDETIRNLQASISSFTAENQQAMDDNGILNCQLLELRAKHEFIKSELEAAVTSKKSAVEKERKQCMEKMELVTKVGKKFACAVVKLNKELDVSNNTIQDLQANISAVTRGKNEATDANNTLSRQELDDVIADVKPETDREITTSFEEFDKTIHSLLEYAIQKRSMNKNANLDVDLSNLIKCFEDELQSETSSTNYDVSNDPTVETPRSKKSRVPRLRRLLSASDSKKAKKYTK